MPTTDFGLKIGARVKAARLLKGLTQEQLAEMAGVSWSTISSLERGQHMVSIERLIDISEVLDSGLELLLCDFLDINNINSDRYSQEIIEMLTLLTPIQKQYVLENMRLVLNIFPNT